MTKEFLPILYSVKQFGMVKFVNDHLKLSIMSDGEQTPSSRSFWKSLELRLPIKIADLKNNTIISKISDDELYSDTSPTQYRLFLESTSVKKSLKEWVEPILQPYHYFTTGDV